MEPNFTNELQEIVVEFIKKYPNLFTEEKDNYWWIQDLTKLIWKGIEAHTAFHALHLSMGNRNEPYQSV